MKKSILVQRKHSVVVVAAFAIALTLVGCPKVKEDLSVKIDGSSTVYPITEAVAEEFSKYHKQIKVSVGVSGTGGGFKKFSRGEIDMVNASRPIKQEEIELCKANQIEYIEIPIAYDGIAVVVNPQNTWVKHLTLQQLKKIWEPEAEGKITRWSDINKDWPKERLILYGPGAASGTFDYFTQEICGKEGASRGDYTASEDDRVLVHGVSKDKYALGYFGFAYYNENKDKLKAVAIDNQEGKGPILPSFETIESGAYKPLSRPLFIYVNKKSMQKEHIKRFVEFYLKNAPVLVKEVGYIPLPKEAYEKALQDFEKNECRCKYRCN